MRKLEIDAKFFIDDHRIRIVESLPAGDMVMVTYMKLISIAAESDRGGFLMISGNNPHTELSLRKLANRSPQNMQYALKGLETYGLVLKNEKDYYYLPDFGTHIKLLD